MPLILEWRRIVDFAVLVAAFYVVLRWASRARALRIVLLITALYAGVLIAREFDLLITAWLLQGAALISVALLVIVFQPEVRRALSRLDRNLWLRPGAGTKTANEIVAATAFELASHGTGALFVISGREPIDELLDDGVVVDGDLSSLLLASVFQKYSPVHDGAAVIQGGRLARVAAVLPLTQRRDVPFEYGTRHRAGMGLAERTDALCVVVSEERSEVTLMRGWSHTLMRTPGQLSSVLDQALAHPTSGAPLSLRIRAALVANWRIRLAALGLAAMIWSAATFSGSAVRVISVPIEFQNVPGGLYIEDQSVPALAVELRGRTFVMNSNQMLGIIARFNLGQAHEGSLVLPADQTSMQLPPGVKVAHISPENVRIRLVRVKVRS